MFIYVYVYLFVCMCNFNKEGIIKMRGSEDLGKFAGKRVWGGNYVNMILIAEILQKLIQ